MMPQKKSFGRKKMDFMQGVKSVILAEWKNCQIGTFETVHEIKKKSLAKRLVLRHYEIAIYKKYL